MGMGDEQVSVNPEDLPELTELELEFLRLLPVDSLAQGMPGASFASLAKDLRSLAIKNGFLYQDQGQGETFVMFLIRNLGKKKVEVVHYGGRCFLNAWDASRLKPLIDPAAVYGESRRIRSYGDREWRQSTLNGSRRRYHGRHRDDV